MSAAIDLPRTFAALRQRHAASSARGSRVLALAIAGRRVVVRFAGTSLYDVMAPPFAHVAVASGTDDRDCDLTLLVWEDDLPPEAWPQGLQAHDLTSVSLCGTDWFVHHDRPSALLIVYDRRAGVACVCARSAEQVQAMDRAHPLRRVVSAWARDRGMIVVHGAAVGGTEGAVLVTGPAGSGKSTTTLAWIAQGNRSAGDDCLVVEPEACIAHSLYATMRLHLDHAARFPGLLPAVDSVEAHATGRDKATVNMARVRPDSLIARMRLRGIVTPHVVGRGPPRLIPETPGRFLREQLANHLSQFFDPTDRGLVAAIAALCRSLPCRRLEIGEDPHAVPAVLSRWLATLSPQTAAS